VSQTCPVLKALEVPELRRCQVKDGVDYCGWSIDTTEAQDSVNHGRIINIGLIFRKERRHRDRVGFMKVHLHDQSVRSGSAINEDFVFIDFADANASEFREEWIKCWNRATVVKHPLWFRACQYVSSSFDERWERLVGIAFGSMLEGKSGSSWRDSIGPGCALRLAKPILTRVTCAQRGLGNLTVENSPVVTSLNRV